MMMGAGLALMAKAKNREFRGFGLESTGSKLPKPLIPLGFRTEFPTQRNREFLGGEQGAAALAAAPAGCVLPAQDRTEAARGAVQDERHRRVAFSVQLGRALWAGEHDALEPSHSSSNGIATRKLPPPWSTSSSSKSTENSRSPSAPNPSSLYRPPPDGSIAGASSTNEPELAFGAHPTPQQQQPLGSRRVGGGGRRDPFHFEPVPQRLVDVVVADPRQRTIGHQGRKPGGAPDCQAVRRTPRFRSCRRRTDSRDPSPR